MDMVLSSGPEPKCSNLLKHQHPRMNDSAVHFYPTEQQTKEPIFFYSEPGNPREFVAGVSRINEKSPVAFLIGDSTVKCGAGNGEDNKWGWGSYLQNYFDTTRISIENCALGGRSSRTYFTEGLWNRVLPAIKPGDYVLIDFGHNDGGPMNTGRARASLPGTGDDSKKVVMEKDGSTEEVYSFGHYIRMYIRQADIRQAFVKVGIGAEKKSKVISEKEKKITAYHEAGHAILFHVLPDVGPVYSVSIIPTGMGAAGYTMPLPDQDNMFETRGSMLQDITVALGGRIAEEEIFGDITTGASQDIKQATATAKSMVTKFGMSEKLGLINYDNDSDEVFIGRDLAHTGRGYGEEVAGEIDREIRSIIDTCYQRGQYIIRKYHDELDACAKLLIEKEKITREEFEALFEGVEISED